MTVIHAITPDELNQSIEVATSDLRDQISALHERLDQLKKAKAPNEYMTVNQTAEHIGVTPFTIRTYTKKGILTRYMLGNSIRYKRREVDAAMIQMVTAKQR